jgi:hypothetical protein
MMQEPGPTRRLRVQRRAQKRIENMIPAVENTQEMIQRAAPILKDSISRIAGVIVGWISGHNHLALLPRRPMSFDR